MLPIQTDRPLAVFDIESTGTNVRTDRIIDLAIVKLLPNGARESHAFRVNPGIPIPPESSRVHGIRDEDVKDCPPFKAIAKQVAAILENCDLCGYNVLRFDIPLLCEEFSRAEVPFSLEGRRIVDPQRIFHKREPRDLSAALMFYTGKRHDGAHGAMDDVLATIAVLEGQFARYADLPRSIEELSEYCNPKRPEWVDSTGKLKWVDGEVVINFGAKQGMKLRDLVKVDPGFLRWMMERNFPRDTTEIVANALGGKFPEPPGGDSGG
ncbi:MAG: 3'-5' exonuclease [Kiritimatiellae bacterium]|nr:3'-5' exonuclease [Kiritimatiellia bacterium]MDW8458918.1 3'-5' exonuclease [Verrucomicrobiota bacterium]